MVDFIGFPEYITQVLIMRVALEALSPIMAVLLCLTLSAYGAYLIGVLLLCRAEDRPSE